jgi:toxin FitB
VSFLVDINVISELRKGERCATSVARWYRSIDDDALFLSALVIGEIRKGIENARPRDPQKADALERWLTSVVAAFADRILPVDRMVAEEWGRMSAHRTAPVIDGLLAATARIHDLVLVTRNAAKVAGLGAKILDPFQA